MDVLFVLAFHAGTSALLAQQVLCRERALDFWSAAIHSRAHGSYERANPLDQVVGDALALVLCVLCVLLTLLLLRRYPKTTTRLYSFLTYALIAWLIAACALVTIFGAPALLDRSSHDGALHATVASVERRTAKTVALSVTLIEFVLWAVVYAPLRRQ